MTTDLRDQLREFGSYLEGLQLAVTSEEAEGRVVVSARPSVGSPRRRLPGLAAAALAAAAVIVVVGGIALLVGTSHTDQVSPGSTPSVTSPDVRSTTTLGLPFTEGSAWSDSGGDFYDWPTIADGPDGVRTTGTEHELFGIRHALATVQETVPAIQDSTVLMFGSTDFYEEAFFVMNDGSDTMIYIGWADLLASVGSQTDPHDIVKLPITITDGMITEQWGDITVTRRTTDTVGDFVVETPQALATVRFFALDNHYGIKIIASPPNEMIEIARAVFEALGLRSLE